MYNNTLNLAPTYDPRAVQPMRDELLSVGFNELLTGEAVDTAIAQTGTTLVVINSVCGCAAGSARPGVALALQHKTIPDHVTTVFAGQDKEAVLRLRELIPGVAPSSPFMVIFNDGKPVFVLPRHHIEGRGPDQIAEILVQAFDMHCSRQGPSVAREVFDNLAYIKACGSKIPLAH